MKALLISIILTSVLLSGCVSVEHAEIKDSTFNTAGWKSAAGESNRIEATTTPRTNTEVGL